MEIKLNTAGGFAEIPAGGAVGDREFSCSVLAKWGHVEQVRPRAALASDSLLGLTCLVGARHVWHTDSIYSFIYSYAIIERLLGAKLFAEYIGDMSPAASSSSHQKHTHTPSPVSRRLLFPWKNPTWEYSAQ